MSNHNKTVKFFPFTLYHAKKNVGGTRIRVDNLVKNWPEASTYKYGDQADVLIFQKVYMTYDFRLHEHWPGITILDVCDPDWINNVDIRIKETFDTVDAIVCPTKPFKEYIRTMTDTPIHVIKDRFDLSEFPQPKTHVDKAKTLVWFGYAHNAETLRVAMPSIENRGLDLLVISNEDPQCFRWAQLPNDYQKKYKFVKYTHPEAYNVIQQADIAIFPTGMRMNDKYKSENKTVISKLLGIPVAKDADELDALMEAEARNNAISQEYDKLKQQYDCVKSVQEYKELINEIATKRHQA